MTPDNEAVTPDAEAMTSDNEAVTPDAEAMTPDNEAVTPDAEVMTPDVEAMTPDVEAMTLDTEAMTSRTEAVASDTEAVASDNAPGGAALPMATAAAAFAALHRSSGPPFLIPNAWDRASASALAAQGFPAVATTSLAVAASAGLPDGAGATRAETLLLARRLGTGPYLLSVDAESGFGDDPDEVARLARELADAGAVGINLEDGRSDGTLAPVALHAAKIAAVKAAVPHLFVNARTDTYWSGGREKAATTSRLQAYEQAGADGVFVPGLTDPSEIATLVKRLETPLNILYTPSGPTVRQLGDLGVRRVSLGSLLFRTALGAALDAAEDIRAGRPVAGGGPTYAQVQALAGPVTGGCRCVCGAPAPQSRSRPR